MALVPNKPEPLGYQLGDALAKFYDEAEPIARLKVPELSPRCSQCVFRRGTFPNGCVTTTMDALKCAMEKDTAFLCAHREKAPDGEFHECAGWQALVLADRTGAKVTMPWKFSDEYSETESK